MLDDVYRALDRVEQATKAGQERMAAVTRFKERVGDLVGHGEAAEGKVRVEATSKSPLSELTIDPRAQRLSSEELSDAIKEAFRAATQDLGDQSRALMSEIGLIDDVSAEKIAAMRADAEATSRDFTASARSAAQQLDELARLKRR